MNSDTHIDGQQHSAQYVWYVVFLLSVVNVFNFADRVALSVLAPSIKADLGLSDAQLGLLIGFAFALFYAICGIPMARWADRGIRRNIIAVTLVTWSVMTALSGAAQNFWHLFSARIGVGVGEAGSLPTGQSMICDYVAPKRRPGIYAIHSFGSVVGMMVGIALAGWLGETVGWRLTFVALGLPGIALAIVVRVTLREPTRGFFDGTRADRRNLSFIQTIEVLINCKTYRWLVAFLAVHGFVVYGLTQWWPSFYQRVFSLSLSSVGVNLGIAIGVGHGIGLLVGGVLGNKAAQRSMTLPLIVSAFATALAVPTTLGSLFTTSLHTSLALAALSGALWSVSSGPVLATIYGILPARMRATGAALSIFLTSVLGLGLGPFVVGLLSDILTPSLGMNALRYALLAPVFLLPFMVIALYAAAKATPGDIRGAGVVENNTFTARPANTIAAK